MNILFPVAAIEGCDADGLNRGIIETAYIDTDAVRMGAGNIEGFDTAGFAEQVSGFMGIEGVGAEIILATE